MSVVEAEEGKVGSARTCILGVMVTVKTFLYLRHYFYKNFYLTLRSYKNVVMYSKIFIIFLLISSEFWRINNYENRLHYMNYYFDEWELFERKMEYHVI